ncbi:hypothetical protein WA026_014357 [Henosepilachna vigintioctopunctata]|uniref:Uncharacterized protein n=1 Tax=Henosepilachna vigintioctopunctata TaxID=420089 RepID=A0AAW1UDD7_9CUCU
MSDEEYDSDSSGASDYGLMKQALPFNCVIPRNFDPSKIPQTAEEYLQYGVYERSLTKPWIRAKIDPAKLTQNMCYQLKIDKLDNSVSTDFLPSQEWQKKKLEEFIEFRDFIQPRLNVSSTNVLRGKISEANFINQSPCFSKIITYSQEDKIKVLEIIIDYLDSLEDGTVFGENVGSWIYAMLSLLDVPLFSSDCHIVRLLDVHHYRCRSTLIHYTCSKY